MAELTKSDTGKPLNPKIDKWNKILSVALTKYEPILANINDNYAAYKGTRDIYNGTGTKKASKKKTSVRKVAFELI